MVAEFKPYYLNEPASMLILPMVGVLILSHGITTYYHV
jgi:hypothetical protein